MEKHLFVGLGNPGNDFSQTRHNLGINALKFWVSEMESRATVTPWNFDAKINAEMAKVVTDSVIVYCLFPHTFMNDSGEAVVKFLKLNPVDPTNIIILHDDLELPFGIVQLVDGGSAKGHNGVRSIYDKLATQEIARLRLGVGRPPEQMEAKDFVLAKFNDDEKSLVAKMINEAADCLSSKI